MIQGGNFSKLSINFYGTYERGTVIIDITMACDKMLGIIRINFGHYVGKCGLWY